MRSFSVWLCCIALLAGCSQELPLNDEHLVELEEGAITLKIQVLKTSPPETLSYLQDADDGTSYVSRTSHDCKARVSTLLYIAAYDSQLEQVGEGLDVEIELDVEPGSISEAEFLLACEERTNA